MSVTYKQSGVDIDAADELISRIKPLAAATRTSHVVNDVGGFASMVSLPSDIPDPLLVSGTDGVGTKLKIAFATGKHDTIGQDLVAMCVNDIITTGARPLFFLDYFGCGKLDVATAEAVVSGVAAGCKLAGCALVGGETAELPGMYADGEYDLAGFAVGVVSKGNVLGPKRVMAGDQLIGIASSGLHSNGFSLARRIFDDSLKLPLDATLPELDATLGDTLLTPTRIYAQATGALAQALGTDLHAWCHITGGGLTENLPRVLPEHLDAKVRLGWKQPAIFDLIARGGPVEDEEMRRTFNLGVGMVAVVGAGHADAAMKCLSDAGETVWLLGSVVEGATTSAARKPGARVVFEPKD